METVAELLKDETVSFTLPKPKEKIRKLRPPVVIRYIFIKWEKKPTAYMVKKADNELKKIIDGMLDGKKDMVMWDKNVHTIDWGLQVDTFVYRGIYTTNKF